MTISLEEHVARACATAGFHGWPDKDGYNERAEKRAWLEIARAAIAAVREREASRPVEPPEQWPPADCRKKSSCDRNGACMYVPCLHAGRQRSSPAPDPAEAMRAEIDWLKSAGRKQGQQIADSVEIEISERAEAMRAKTIDECEAIVRAGTPVMNPHSQFVCRTLADRIAALKGKGEG